MLCYLHVSRMPFVWHLYILVSHACHSYVTQTCLYFIYMYPYAIRMPLVCNCMPSVCHSYVRVCHLYVTHMYLYVIHMSLVYHPYVTLMYSHVICISLLCRMSSYVLVCHCMSIVCGFTMNRIVMVNQRKQNIKHI